MSLSDYVLETRTVKAGNTSFTVRGLCYDDLTILLGSHAEQLNSLMDRFTGADVDSGPESKPGAKPDAEKPAPGLDLKELLMSSPALIHQIIVLVSDDPADEKKLLKIARQLPFGTQLEAVTHIFQLTVEQAGGLEKLLGSLIQIFRSLSPAMQTLSTGITAIAE